MRRSSIVHSASATVFAGSGVQDIGRTGIVLSDHRINHRIDHREEITKLPNKSTIHRTKRGYYRTTIPRAIGDALDAAGKYVTWKTPSDWRLVLKLHDEKPDESYTTIQSDYKLVVKKELADGWELEGEEVEWRIGGGSELEMRLNNRR